MASNITPIPVKKNLTGRKDGQTNFFEANDASSFYERDEGILVLPIAGPPGTAAAIIQVHAPYGIRRVKWEAAKRGVPPPIPTPKDTASGDKILSSSIIVHQPRPEVSQSKLGFAMEGEYVYVQGVMAASGKPRGNKDFYQSGSLSYTTPLLYANSYLDIGMSGILGGVLGALSPEQKTVVIQNTIAQQTDQIINAVSGGDNSGDYTYNFTTISPVFFNDELIG